MRRWSLICLMLSLLAFDSLALKPGPNQIIRYVDPQTRNQLLSTPGTDPYSTDGTTEVLNIRGKKLWSMKQFIGHHHLLISPDGLVLITSGDFHFGSIVSLNPEQVFATIYRKGKVIRVIRLSELVQGDVRTLVEKLQVQEIGGGYVSEEDFVEKTAVDWKKKKLTIQIKSQAARTFSF